MICTKSSAHDPLLCHPTIHISLRSKALQEWVLAEWRVKLGAMENCQRMTSVEFTCLQFSDKSVFHSRLDGSILLLIDCSCDSGWP